MNLIFESDFCILWTMQMQCIIPLFLKDIRNLEQCKMKKKLRAPAIVLTVYHSQIFTRKVYFAKSSRKLHK